MPATKNGTPMLTLNSTDTRLLIELHDETGRQLRSYSKRERTRIDRMKQGGYVKFAASGTRAVITELGHFHACVLLYP